MASKAGTANKRKEMGVDIKKSHGVWEADCVGPCRRISSFVLSKTLEVLRKVAKFDLGFRWIILTVGLQTTEEDKGRTLKDCTENSDTNLNKK